MSTSKKVWTWGEAYTDLAEELEIEDEVFVDKSRVRKWFNEGIDDAEAKIIRMYPEYFLTRLPPVAFEAGVDSVALPESIYGLKIRKIIVNNGQRAYEATRMNDLDKFLEYRSAQVGSTASVDDDLSYFPVNDDEDGASLLFSPTPSSAAWSYEIWFIRNANRVSEDSDKIDIPEFAEYCFQWVRERVERKRRPGTPAHQAEAAKLSELELTMLTTLQDMIPDDADQFPADTSYYEDHN